MPEYLAPGVYMEEVSSGPPPIAGVGTTTTGMIGVTRRGPTSGPATLVTNYSEFVRAFGGPFDFGAAFAGLQDLPYAVKGFFANGGLRLYVSRVAPSSASAAKVTLTGGTVTRLRRDVASGATVLPLLTTRGLRKGGTVRLQMVRDGVTTTSADLVISTYDRVTDQVTVPALTSAFDAAYTTVLTDVDNLAGDVPAALANPGAAKPASFGLVAANPGSWGSGINIAGAYRSAGRSVVKNALLSGADTAVPVVSTAGFYVGAWVEINRGVDSGNKIYRKVTAISGNSLILDGANFAAGSLDPVAPITETRIISWEFDLTISYADPVERTTVTERYTGLTLANIPGRYYVDALAASNLVSVDSSVAAPADDPFNFPCPANGVADTLSTGGSDGSSAPTDADYLGYDNGPNNRSGLLALEDVEEIALLAAPGVTSLAVQAGLIEQATLLMNRFVVLDPVAGTSGTPATLDQIQSQASNFDSHYAAIYYPRVVVSDPLTGATRVVAPSGHVLGVYARVDNTVGVHKAPANEVILGITALETSISKGQQEILNPLNINVLRDLRTDGRGLRIYGARCLTSDQDWKYINVRRLFIFVESSLDKGLQWVVFQPNDQRLWQRVSDSVSIFLTGVWRDGALMGSKAAEAFFVTCDRSTMDDDDIINGRLRMEVGMAPVFPAEFVIVRIGQWMGGSAVQEL